MIDLSKYDKYLVPTNEGLGVKADAPQGIKDEIRVLNDEYFSIYGENLIDLGPNTDKSKG